MGEGEEGGEEGEKTSTITCSCQQKIGLSSLCACKRVREKECVCVGEREKENGRVHAGTHSSHATHAYWTTRIYTRARTLCMPSTSRLTLQHTLINIYTHT